MKKSLPGTDAIATQIDRLVSGDLPEPDRRSLLAWLDEEPTRWRGCALAFLEAQVWEQATTREGEAPVEPCVGTVTQGSECRVQESGGWIQPARATSWSSTANWLALAGALLVAFAAGTLAGQRWFAGPWLKESSPPVETITAEQVPAAPRTRPLLATVSVRTNLDPRLTAQVQLPVEPAAEPLAGASSISEYDRKQWERRGYDVVEETRYLPAKMPDGRTVMVPVNRVHLKLKGTPVS